MRVSVALLLILSGLTGAQTTRTQVNTDSAQTLTNKTLTSGTLGSLTVTGTLSGGTYTGGTFTNTGLRVQDTDASHRLTLAPGSNLTADRTLTLTTGDASRTLTLSGDATLTGANTGDQTITLTGDVTGSGTGSFAATLASNAVTNAKAAQMPANTLKGNNTGSTANAADLTAAEAKTLLAISNADVSGLGSMATQNAGSVSITGGAATFSNTGLGLRDTDASHVLTLAPGSNLTAARVLTLTTGDASRTLTLTGDATLTGNNTGNQTITLTGDVTGSGTGSFATTMATVNSNTGSYGSASTVPVITVNAKGLVTAVSTASVNTASVGDGDKGDVTVSASGATWTVDSGVVSRAKMDTSANAGLAKAWVNFNGVPATPTIRASHNVSSVTKNGTGVYTINFSSAMADANYVVSLAAAAPGAISRPYDDVTARTTTTIRVVLFDVSGNQLDASVFNVVIFGN